MGTCGMGFQHALATSHSALHPPHALSAHTSWLLFPYQLFWFS